MTITADLGGKNYVLGRGQVFFDRFAVGVAVTALTRGAGERYLGNTPEFSTTSESEDLEHYDSDGGVKVKDDSVQLSLNRSGTMSCDNIDTENVSLYFIGENGIITQADAAAVVEVVEGVSRGRFIQLGQSASNPSGVRNVANVIVKSGGGPGWATTVAQPGNYEVDDVRGRLYIESDAPDIDDIDIQITYDTVASTREQVVSGSVAIYGALRFVSNNPKGENRDYYFPYVKLSPNGDYALKGDDWQSMSFNFEVLKKSSNIAPLYVDGQPTLV
jgi:hypothetical protein